MCHVSGQLYKTFRTAATDMLFKVAKKSMDLFPQVPRTDAVLFIVQCHGLSENGCYLSTSGVQDDNSRD